MNVRVWARAAAPVVVLLFACDSRLDAGYNLLVKADAAADGSAAVSPAFAINDVATELSLNGNAELLQGQLVLTQPLEDQEATAFFPTPFTISASTTMEVHLVFQIDPSEIPADGVALVWHADPKGPRALGGKGGGISIGFLSPKVAVVFDTHNGNGLELAPAVFIQSNNDRPSDQPHARTEPFPLASGKVIHCWVNYRSGDLQVYVSESAVRPNEPWVRAEVALEVEVGPSVFFGVAAATGVKFSRHVVHSLRIAVAR